MQRVHVDFNIFVKQPAIFLIMSNSIISALEKVTEGDKDFMRELADAFIVNFKEFSEKIIDSVDSRNIPDYRSMVHKVKPSFLTLEMEDDFEKVSNFSHNIDEKSEAEIEAFKQWIIEMSEETIRRLEEVKS